MKKNKYLEYNMMVIHWMSRYIRVKYYSVMPEREHRVLSDIVKRAEKIIDEQTCVSFRDNLTEKQHEVIVNTLLRYNFGYYIFKSWGAYDCCGFYFENWGKIVAGYRKIEDDEPWQASVLVNYQFLKTYYKVV